MRRTQGPPFPAAVERGVQQYGRELSLAWSTPRITPASLFQQTLLNEMTRDEEFRQRLLRFVDVFAAIESLDSRLVKDLYNQYVVDGASRASRSTRYGIHAAGILPAPALAAVLRFAVRRFARRFIVPDDTKSIKRAASSLAARRRIASFDVLGEAVVSEHEADAMLHRYLVLLGSINDAEPSESLTAAGTFTKQISVKLSSLTGDFNPVDPQGTYNRIQPRLAGIIGHCIERDIGLTIDAEEFHTRWLTWHIFTRLFGPGGEFADWHGPGIVLQAYLRDAEDHLARVTRFAIARGAPVQVRLVKGAYWDYESIVAARNGWPAPVFDSKAQTDINFERLLSMLLQQHPHIRTAVGSHNIRAHALAEALRSHLGLPENSVEHQTLYRTAEGLSNALGAMGFVAREYIPVGDLIPGMAYLVRRILENTSQLGVLTMDRERGRLEEVLKPPVQAASSGQLDERVRSRPANEFKNVPPVRLFLDHERENFRQVLGETRKEFGREYPLRLGGELIRTAERVRISSVNPSSPAQLLGTVHGADIEHAPRAVELARKGFQEWSAMDHSDRVTILNRGVDLLTQRRLKLAAWVVYEGGRTWSDALADVDEAIDHLAYNICDYTLLDPGVRDQFQPRGVIAVIPPWNFPAALPMAMMGGALAGGNSVVLKSAEQTPIVAHMLVEALHEAGVPTDSLIHLPGEGESVGSHLVESPEVDMVAFTGSKAVGVEIAARVANVALNSQQFKKAVTEMGGKNAIAVTADADLDEAVRGVVTSAFGHANQKCSACSRVFVHSTIFGRFRDRLEKAVLSMPIGSADDPGTFCGPVIDGRAKRKITTYQDIARSEGTVIVDHSTQTATDSNLVKPLVVEIETDRAPYSRVMSEEIFGPVLSLARYNSEDELIRLINGTEYGLTAGIYSRNPRLVRRLVEEIEAGNIYVNRPITGALVGVEPFGGWKLSGTGPKTGGEGYVLAYLRRKGGYREGEPVPELPDGEPGAARAGNPVEPWTQCGPGERAEILARWLDLLRAEHIDDLADALPHRTGLRQDEMLSGARSAIDAVSEIAVRQPTIDLPGQTNYVLWSKARGAGLVMADDDASPAMVTGFVAGALLAGNGLSLLCTGRLETYMELLVQCAVSVGIPQTSFRLQPAASRDGFAAAAQAPVQFVITDLSLETTREVHKSMAKSRINAEHPWITRLITVQDSLHPGEPGFLRQFVIPKTVAIQTLRHGANLPLGEVSAD